MSELISFQVERARQWLAQQGCNIVNVRQAKRRPVISIDVACPVLQRNATVLIETKNGQRSLGYTARVGDCLVHWHQPAN
ncbi:hypothetical protein [Alkalimonas mucilaginosa]|uniref:Uncharacterized protein n=1 Tax=Alkalimonas mucilaginosa TaxID=3057676 RepID=A0ABU7JJC3_9GAMM|nr:hypothetical protein [Alkalimonas sp. MEB004]MEE2025058.1 hypothetical protein [Alkalimonas sp. MEB004]